MIKSILFLGRFVGWASLGRKILNSFIRPCPPYAAWERELLVGESREKPERALLEKTTGRKFLAQQLLSQSQSRRVVIGSM
ncbi:hypothetical protein [Moorena sp. SIO3H5]|uniref:hypothetical protein n=1 Tax=Moorena sp. SIO3H5 TaxID=2607834 RepID=UPI0013BCC46D|nr:hypothetical protein [Moorena sp. SIO3H5]NEO67982.1 hypothetical protein [Moorena sp. SIO3H5]